MRRIYIGIAFLGVLLPQAQVHACGVSLEKPVSYFDGVDFQGHVQLVKKIGKLDTASVSLPVYLIFNSGNHYLSPYSADFDIPLLSSRMEQVDQNTFLMRSPTGWILPFMQNNKDKDILDGPGGMKGEIRGNIINAWSECGDKLVFQKGRIIEFQIKNSRLDYVYSGGRISEIKENGNPILKVGINSNTGEMTELFLNEKKIKFEWGQRAKIQSLGGKNFIGGMEKTLSKVIFQNGNSEKFEFGIDSKLQPLIKINGDREIGWNPNSGLIIRDNDINYNIKPAKDYFGYAEIERRNSKTGRQEYWFHNDIDKTDTHGEDGVMERVTYFRSGILSGRVRKIEEIAGQKSRSIYKASYDENGHLVKEETPSRIIVNEYDDFGRRIRTLINGKKVWETQFDDRGRITFECNGNLKKKFSYFMDGSKEEVLIFETGFTIVKETNSNNLLTKLKIGPDVIFNGQK